MKQSDSTFTLFHLHFYNVVKLQYLQICTMLMCIEYYTHVPLNTMLWVRIWVYEINFLLIQDIS